MTTGIYALVGLASAAGWLSLVYRNDRNGFTETLLFAVMTGCGLVLIGKAIIG